MDFVMDPKQVIFTYNQIDVINGILNREFDVGFIRTDTIERSLDANGKPLDPDLFKVIDPKIYILDDGNLFPFLHSTGKILKIGNACVFWCGLLLLNFYFRCFSLGRYKRGER